jgi:hypothetical protein
LFGADPTPGLVAAALADDGRAVRLWLREGADTRIEHVPFTPFLLAADEALVRDAAGLVSLERLRGGGALCWRATFASWGGALGARDQRATASWPSRSPTPPGFGTSFAATGSTKPRCSPSAAASSVSAIPT